MKSKLAKKNLRLNACFLKKAMKTYRKKKIKLFDFQIEVIKKMILVDSGFFNVNFHSHEIKTSFSESQVALKVGNGKTIIALGRIDSFLKGDVLEEEIFTPDLLIKRNTNIKKRDQILIVVPNNLLVQWIHEMISFWDYDFVEKNVYIQDKLIIEDDELALKKIILTKHSLMCHFRKSTAENLRFLFIDESHQLNKIHDFPGFTWNLSATHNTTQDHLNKIAIGFLRVDRSNILNINEELNQYSHMNGTYLSLPEKIEIHLYFQCSNIIRDYNLADLKNTILFDPNSTEIILKRLDSDCKSKKKQLIKNEIENLYKLVKSNRIFNKPFKIFKSRVDSSDLDGFSSDFNDLTTNHKLLIKYLMGIKFNQSIKDELKDLILDFDKVMNVIKKEAAKINQKCKEDKNKLLNDYCNVCLDETKENILSACCSQKICCECLKSIIRCGMKTCPMCRQDIIEKLLANETNIVKPKTLKNFLKTYLDVMAEVSIKFKKILVVFSSDEVKLRKMFTDSLNIAYDQINSINSVKTSKSISNFKFSPEKMILFISSKYCCTGLNLEVADCMVFMNEFDEKDQIQMIGRANRYPRTEPLTIYYLKENLE